MAESKKGTGLSVNRLKESVDKIFYSKESKADRQKMNDYLDKYRGKWWNETKLKDAESRIYANLFFSVVMTTAPLLTDNKPIWYVRARKPFLNNYVQTYNLALEYLWDKMEMNMQLFKFVLDALIMKIGIGKVYFCPLYDDIRIEVVDPRTFFISPGYDDIWSAPMCGTVVKKPFSWIVENYPEKAEEVEDDDSGETVTNKEEAWENNERTVTVYEVWMRSTEVEDYYVNADGNEVDRDTEGSEKKKRKKYPYGRFVTFSGGVILDDKASPYEHGKPPYVALYDYMVPHEFMGMGEGDQIMTLVESFNRNLQLMDTWTKDYCDPPWLLDTRAAIDTGTVKRELPVGGALFEFDGTFSENPLKKVQSTPLDPTVLNHMQFCLKLNEEVTGVTDITKGQVGKSQRQSATEIQTLLESSYTRTRQRVRNLEHFIERMLYLVLEIMQQFYTEKRYINKKTDEGIEYYPISNDTQFAASTIVSPESERENMTDEMIEKEDKDYEEFKEYVQNYGYLDSVYAAFDLEVQTNSTLPMDRQSQANLMLRLLEMGGGNPVIGMPIWKLVMEQLKIPKWQDVIKEMQTLFEQEKQGGQNV